MSYSGFSKFQAEQITGLDSRLATTELAITQNLSSATARYDLIDIKDAEQDARLDAVESRATALESDIATRVEAEINSKVAQVVFDALETELRDTDSALTSTLATKVAATVQYELDESQNSTIASKVAIADYDLYVSTVSAALDTKVNVTDYDMYVSTTSTLVASKVDQTAYDYYMSFNDGQVASKVAQADYNLYVSQNDALVASKVSQADYDLYTSTTSTLVSAKVEQNDYNYYVNMNDAAVASKVSQDDYTAYVALNNAAVASKVATADYEVSEATQNAAIALKAAAADLSAYIAANDTAVATKAAQADVAAYVAANDAAVASKVAQVEYDATLANTNNFLNVYESRFNAVEEFIRALLATYSITKPDNTLYNYTGACQQIAVPPPPFAVIGKRRAGSQTWFLTLQFTEYGYNTLLGDVLFELPLPAYGGAMQALGKSDINPDSKYIEVPLPGTRVLNTGDWNGAFALPFNIQYRNSQYVPTHIDQLTVSEFNALPVLNEWTPESPANVTFNAISKILSFDVPNPYCIDFVDMNINGAWYQVQDTSDLFSFVGTRVSINLNKSPVPVAGTVQIFTRYDKILMLTPGANPSQGGFAEITVA